MRCPHIGTLTGPMVADPEKEVQALNKEQLPPSPCLGSHFCAADNNCLTSGLLGGLAEGLRNLYSIKSLFVHYQYTPW